LGIKVFFDMPNAGMGDISNERVNWVGTDINLFKNSELLKILNMTARRVQRNL